MCDAVADVAGVAVAQEHMADGWARTADPPAMQALAVLGRERHVTKLEACGRRGLRDRAGRDVEKRVQ